MVMDEIDTCITYKVPDVMTCSEIDFVGLRHKICCRYCILVTVDMVSKRPAVFPLLNAAFQ